MIITRLGKIYGDHILIRLTLSPSEPGELFISFSKIESTIHSVTSLRRPLLRQIFEF